MNWLRMYYGIVFAVFLLGSVGCNNSTNSSYTDLDLSERPLIKIYPEQHPLYAPTSKFFVLMCRAFDDGENVVTDMAWRDPTGNNVQDETNTNRTTLSKPTKNLLQLVFLHPQRTDSGAYSCFAVYSNNETLRATVVVNFYDELKFENCNEYQNLVYGTSGEIVCRVTGNPLPQISWLKDGSPITSDWRYTVLSDKLSVKLVTDETQGQYTLEASVLWTGQFSMRTINVTVQNRVCSFYEFRCHNGRCINRAYVCDGDNDCGDWSDELNCPSPTPTPTSCSFREFRCDNGRCISSINVCNRINNCGDWSDERNCLLPTSTLTPCLFSNQFRCDNGRCVSRSYVCNGENNCGDWSDESNCPSTRSSTPIPTRCSFERFLCDNGNCITRNYVCDGDNDCGDWSDERGCVSSKAPVCPPGRFSCRNKRCIRARYVCDGDNDCGDFSDESDCIYHSTGRNTNLLAISGVTIGFSVLIFILIPTIWCVKIRKQKKKVAAAVSAQPGIIGQTPQHLPEGFNASKAATPNGSSQEGGSVQVLHQQSVSGIVTRNHTASYPSSELNQTQVLSETTQQHENVHSTALPDQLNTSQPTTHQIPQSNLYPTLPHQAYPTAPESCPE